jgi:nucleotide-binding universal stress UspA family protein
MGGHGGASGLTSRILGTVATTVVAEASTTVTVVRE